MVVLSGLGDSRRIMYSVEEIAWRAIIGRSLKALACSLFVFHSQSFQCTYINRIRGIKSCGYL